MLAKKLTSFKQKKNTVILAIPRGGVVVGKELSLELNLPLDVVVVKKLSAPGNPELAIGAVAKEVKVVDWELALRSAVDQDYLDREVKDKQQQVDQRLKLIYGKRKPVDLKDKSVIITDDGIATGATIQTAVDYVKKQQAKRIILAIPVSPPDTVDKLKKEVDKIVVLEKPLSFAAVGQFYQEFPQVSDEEVVRILNSKK